MNEDLHRHLDGELSREEMTPEGRREAESWDRLLAAFRQEGSPVTAPPWLESRVMAEIEAFPEPGLLRRVVAWFLNPRAVRVSPLTGTLSVAVLATVLLLGRPVPDAPPTVNPSGTGPENVAAAGLGAAGAGAVIYVQFVLDAPGASSVSVAGDFNEWEDPYALQDLDGDGVWTGRVPVRPGVHAYMFLVDDSTWMTDPHAERYAEDGFGNRNAILAVATPAT